MVRRGRDPPITSPYFVCVIVMKYNVHCLFSRPPGNNGDTAICFPTVSLRYSTFLADRTIGRAFGTVCRLSSVCNVLYCGETVRPSEKVSEGVNRKPGPKSSFFWVAAIFLLPVSPLRPPRRPFLPYFCPYTVKQSVLDGRN